MLAWALLADVVPLYPLYALLFADAGLSGARISMLFAIWSGVGMTAEVPTGLIADRFRRRWSLVVGGTAQAAAYAVWITRPDFAGFAVGFAVWGVGGAFVSGASEALLYEGLAAQGAESHFPRLLGRMTALGLLAQLPAAAAATVLFALGGYPLVGWSSVGVCLAAALLAAMIPEPPAPDAEAAPAGAKAGADEELPGLRNALAELRRAPAVRGAVAAVALLTGLDAFEEYVPLLAQDWSVPVAVVPLAVLGLPLAGAIGAALGERGTASGQRLALKLVVAALLLCGACLLRVPPALALAFGFYGGYQSVLVAAGSALQQRITGRSRATVTSVAALAGELTAFGIYAAWAAGGGIGVAALVAAVALVLPHCLGAGPSASQLVERTIV